jgi:hypothetical protein
MTSRDLSTQRPDWRFFAALSVVFAILVVVAAVSFQTEQKFSGLHAPAGVVNIKPVAAINTQN